MMGPSQEKDKQTMNQRRQDHQRAPSRLAAVAASARCRGSPSERAACRLHPKREAGQGLEQEGGLAKATPAAARRCHPPARYDPPHGVLSVTNIGPPGC